MRIAFIGQQDFGKAAMEAFVARGDEIAGVFCAPTKPGAKPDALLEAAQARGLPVFQFESLRDPRAATQMRALEADLGVMAYVLQFAPQELVTIPRHGTIQFHPSLLPRHRGPSSINWPIALGATETGLTIFRPTDGLDEGPVILQKRCSIGPDETLGELYFGKLFPMGIAALLETADLVVAGRHEERFQEETQAGYEGWMGQTEARIHWSSHIDQIYDLVRACNPAPGAWTTCEGKTVHLFDCRKHPARTYGAVRGKPGVIERVTDTSVFVSAHGGQLELLKLREEGGKKIAAGELGRQRGWDKAPLMSFS